MTEPRIVRAPATATLWACLSLLLLAPVACAQAPAKPATTEAPAKPGAAQATSTFSYDVVDDQQIIAITNVTYQPLDPYFPDRKQSQRLGLRTTPRTKSVIDEIGIEGSVTVDAWPLGTGLDRPPLHSVKQEAVAVARRFVGFEVPPDDAADPRLREPHVIGVLTYAAAERVIRESLVTCDAPDRAAVYRSYADETRELVLQTGAVPVATKGKEYP